MRKNVFLLDKRDIYVYVKTTDATKNGPNILFSKKSTRPRPKLTHQFINNP